MTVLIHNYQSQNSTHSKALIDSAVITKARSDKNKKHNYPKNRKPRTIDYAKKIQNDDFIFNI